MQSKALPRILPFALFMSFIGLEELARFLIKKGLFTLSETALLYLYPIKTFAVVCLLLLLWKNYDEIILKDLRNVKKTLISLFSGLLIFFLWINLDFSFATQGNPQGFNPFQFESTIVQLSMISVRIAGAVLVVPVMEELFWRSFLIRYLVTNDFSKTPIGQFTWFSFLATSLLFGLEHHYILAGVVAGIIFNLLLYQTKSLAQCILAHAVANLGLAIYVLLTGEWRFW